MHWGLESGADLGLPSPPEAEMRLAASALLPPTAHSRAISGCTSPSGPFFLHDESSATLLPVSSTASSLGRIPCFPTSNWLLSKRYFPSRRHQPLQGSQLPPHLCLPQGGQECPSSSLILLASFSHFLSPLLHSFSSFCAVVPTLSHPSRECLCSFYVNQCDECRNNQVPLPKINLPCIMLGLSFAAWAAPQAHTSP